MSFFSNFIRVKVDLLSKTGSKTTENGKRELASVEVFSRPSAIHMKRNPLGRLAERLRTDWHCEWHVAPGVEILDLSPAGLLPFN